MRFSRCQRERETVENCVRFNWHQCESRTHETRLCISKRFDTLIMSMTIWWTGNNVEIVLYVLLCLFGCLLKCSASRVFKYTRCQQQQQKNRRAFEFDELFECNFTFGNTPLCFILRTAQSNVNYFPCYVGWVLTKINRQPENCFPVAHKYCEAGKRSV